MGQTTPNIGIYIPAAGETNYDASFATGMVNVDQHDHSGGPNKGVQIASSGLAPDSVTYDKLAPDITDTATGLGQETGGFSNRLAILGILASIYGLGSNGIICKSGSSAFARAMTSDSNIVITNPGGVAGAPNFSLAANISVTNITAATVTATDISCSTLETTTATASLITSDILSTGTDGTVTTSRINGPSGGGNILLMQIAGINQAILSPQLLDLGASTNGGVSFPKQTSISTGYYTTGGIAPAASADVLNFIISPNQMYIVLTAVKASGGSGTANITIVAAGDTLLTESSVSNVFSSPNPTLGVNTTTGQISITNNQGGALEFNVSWLRLF